jgi:hypothetical protein
MIVEPISARLTEAMLAYFHGEKIEALMFILPIGLLSLVFGCWLLVEEHASFARGVSIPFLVMGIVMTAVGATVGFRTPSQLRRLQQEVVSAPLQATQAEVARMTQVNGKWNSYLILWGVMGVAGLALRFATKGDLTQGLGIALVFFSGVGLMVDGFAERRTHPYVSALRAIAQEPDMR